MTTEGPVPNPRFPWGFFFAVLAPVSLVIAMLPPSSLTGPAWRMTLGTGGPMLLGPLCAAVVVWGIVRLNRGEGQVYPALRWFVWLPVLVGVAGVALG